MGLGFRLRCKFLEDNILENMIWPSTILNYLITHSNLHIVIYNKIFILQSYKFEIYNL